MEQIELNREVVKVEDGKVFIRSSSVVSHTFKECIGIIPKHEANIVKLKKEKDDLTELVKDKFWEEEFKDINLKMSKTNELICLFNEALKPHFDELTDKGRKFISSQKKELLYDGHEKGDSKVVLSVEIRNSCRDFLGLDDINHPVMNVLREEFEVL